MPLYEYKCDLCKCLWEEVQKFSDPVLTVCKGCEQEGGVRKLFSGQIAFHLKGSGWYKDGYSTASPPPSDTSPPPSDTSESSPTKKEKTVETMRADLGLHEYDAKHKDNRGRVEEYFEGNVPTEEDGAKITDPYHMGERGLSWTYDKNDKDWMDLQERQGKLIEKERKDHLLALHIEDDIRRDEVRERVTKQTGSENLGLAAAFNEKRRNTKYIQEIDKQNAINQEKFDKKEAKKKAKE